ncbi:aldehyde dehydrogenase [Klebsiella pneumoniae]|uniref:Aldehyde dehydrogenase n=1 Tax=Klebsiella pneumoniae TaxID=573 RepID=A0A377TQ00_KLEPN|nr:aldehyde dehydrogenase [Klebsiella pneumoniae]
MSHARPGLTTCSQYDAALHALSAARQRWAETSVNRRLALLRQIKDALAGIAPAWVAAAAAAKGLSAGDPLAGEEWLAGPCALMVGCNGLIATLEQLEEKTFLRRIPLRTLADGRLALRVVPARSGIGCFCLVFALRYGCSQASPGPISTAMRRGHTTSRLPRGRASWRWCLAPAMWPRLRHWMCYTSCLLRIRSAC